MLKNELEGADGLADPPSGYQCGRFLTGCGAANLGYPVSPKR